MTTKARITLGEGVGWFAPMLFTSNKIRFSSVKVHLYLYELMKADKLSQPMRFPTMWYVRPPKPQISLRIRAV